MAALPPTSSQKAACRSDQAVGAARRTHRLITFPHIRQNGCLDESAKNG